MSENTHTFIKRKIEELSGLSEAERALKFLQLEQIAYRDKLTGLLNQTGLIETFNSMVEVLKETEKELVSQGEDVSKLSDFHLVGFRGYGAWCFDLVGLHATNENINEGREVGNRKLRDVANSTARSFKRGVDIVARVDSDEFIVLSPNFSKSKEASEKMFQEVKSTLPDDVKVNAVLAWFSKDTPVEKAVDLVKEKLSDAKRKGPRDENKRSLGFGMVYAGEYEK